VVVLYLIYEPKYSNHINPENFTDSYKRNIQKVSCYYLVKNTTSRPKYINPEYFKKNMIPLIKNNNLNLYIKSSHIQNIKKNMEYYFSKYNREDNENITKKNVDLSINTHLEMVMKILRNKTIHSEIKIKMFLTLVNIPTNDLNTFNIVFSPYIMTNNDNKVAISIKTKKGKKIIVIGIFNLDNKRVEFNETTGSQIRNCIISAQGDNYDYDNIDMDSAFSETEVKTICNDELSIRCENNLNIFNNSQDLYQDLYQEINDLNNNTGSNNSEFLEDLSCDIFSNQTPYIDQIKNSFY